MSARPKIERLMRKGIRLLQEEKAAILDADYTALATLNQRKEAIASEINALTATVAGHQHEVWTEIRALGDILARRAEENQGLLVAARDGIAEARHRIEIVLGAGDEMGVYNARGTRLSGDAPRGRTFTF